MGWQILLYVPNLIGYFRILLATTALCVYTYPAWFVPFYFLSILLDGVDGFAARKLNQTSAFGAWFDVVIDLYSRGLLWCALFRWGYLILMVEWLTFLSTHTKGPNWKIPEESYPALVKMVMANGFKTPMGFLAVGSLHLLPLWLYGYEMGFLSQVLAIPMWFQFIGIAFFTVGRTVCFSVELFYLTQYIKHLLEETDKE